MKPCAEPGCKAVCMPPNTHCSRHRPRPPRRKYQETTAQRQKRKSVYNRRRWVRRNATSPQFVGS